MSYATGDDLIQRYDIDVIGALATDDREQLGRLAVPSDPNVATALADASGEIDVNLIAGGRYTPAQLAALSGGSRSHLIRITCAVAMACLFERRPGMYTEMAEAICKISRANLAALARGQNVFGIPELANGNAATIATDTVQSIDIENLNLMPGRMSRFFPGTAQRTPRN